MVTYGRPTMQSSSSKHVDWVFSLEYNEDYPKRKDSPSNLAPSSSGTRGRRACGDGPMASPGVPVGCPGAF